MAAARCMFARFRRMHATASIFALRNYDPSMPLAAGELLGDDPAMAGDDKEDFRIRPRRSPPPKEPAGWRADHQDLLPREPSAGAAPRAYRRRGE